MEPINDKLSGGLAPKYSLRRYMEYRNMRETISGDHEKYERTETEEEAVKLIEDAIYVHSKAGFGIRNFISNSLVVLEQLSENLLTNKIQSEVDRLANEEMVLEMDYSAAGAEMRCEHGNFKMLLPGAEEEQKNENSHIFRS
ncbi:hypothetical protein JTB14_009025 [Gonioctena quinquepunctata]|nr:hypothetical protein JTB14_009025 [Gonioctena quinquepunctata]